MKPDGLVFTILLFTVAGCSGVRSLELVETPSDGTITGVQVNVDANRPVPKGAAARITKLVLVDSENPHFRATVALWDGREYKVEGPVPILPKEERDKQLSLARKEEVFRYGIVATVSGETRSSIITEAGKIRVSIERN
jgi:hypothetical protein